MRGHRSPGSQSGGSRSGNFMQQPRSRRETLFLLGIVAIAGFFIWRLCQFGANVPQGNTFTAVLSTTQARTNGAHCLEPASCSHAPDIWLSCESYLAQVLQRVRGSRDDEEPAKVITELVIGRDQTDQRYKQHRKTNLQVFPCAELRAPGLSSWRLYIPPDFTLDVPSQPSIAFGCSCRLSRMPGRDSGEMA